MKFGSLFAGIGGFDLGFERAAMRCAWQVEIDDRCNQVLAHHWPDVKRYGDVRNVGKRNLESVDLVAGGFPCQDVSVAGRREGLDGKRSGLWFEFLRVVAELEPRWVIVENVPGLLSSNERRDFATVLSGLAECGYMGAYRVLNAEFWGVPQRRRRVFIVGCLGDWRSAAEVLFERTGSPWDLAPSRETKQNAANPLGAKTSGYRNDLDNDTFVFNWQSGGDVRLGISSEATSALHSSQTPAVMAISENQRAELRLTPYSRQLTSGGGKPGQGYPCIAQLHPTLRGQPNQGPGRMADDSAQAGLVRRLTPLECERLQGFPDNFTAVDGMSDSARYRMLGNAVAVPVAEWLGKRIIERDISCNT